LGSDEYIERNTFILSSKNNMQNKTKILFSSVVIFMFSFLLTGKVMAGSCEDITGQLCKANDCDSYGMDVATPASAFTCDPSFVCCKPRPASIDPCASLADGVGCTTTDNKAGTCKNKVCVAGVADYCVNLADGATCLTSNSKSGTCKNKTCVATSGDDEGDNDDGGGGGGGGASGWSSNDLRIFNLPEAPVYLIITNILDWLLTIVGVIALITLVIAGMQYFFVATDEKMLETAKKTMRAAIIGIVVALSGMVVIYAVEGILTAQTLF
jgi:hypothetical protein